MDRIRSLAVWLQDPILVADFQHYFGIRKTSAAELLKTDDSLSEEEVLSSTCSTASRRKNVRANGTAGHTLLGSGDSTRSRSQSPSTDDMSGSECTRTRLKNFFFQPIVAEGDKLDSDDGECALYVPTKPFWHMFFLLGSALGDEIFYASFLPLWFWNIDGAVGRRTVLVWLVIMYIGQAMKDVIQIPRPACPPAIRVGKKWALEFGFPSTHSMVAIALPGALVAFTYGRYQYPVALGCGFALVWCLCICGSRLYLGMHSVLDVVAGLILGAVILAAVIPLADPVDDFLIRSSYSPPLFCGFILALTVFYPASTTWNPARGDTVVICAVVLGFYCGSWMNYYRQLISAPTSSPPYTIIWPTYGMLGQMLARSSIGLCSVVATRAIFKSLSYATVCALLRLNQQDVSQRRSNVTQRQFVTVELSYKFATYVAFGFNVIHTAPLVFRLIGIERPEFYTEI